MCLCEVKVFKVFKEFLLFSFFYFLFGVCVCLCDLLHALVVKRTTYRHLFSPPPLGPRGQIQVRASGVVPFLTVPSHPPTVHLFLSAGFCHFA